MQPSKSGGLLRSQVPDGVTPLGPMEKAQETSVGRETGKNIAGAQNQLAGTSAAAQDTIRLVDEVLSHPSLPDSVGPIDGFLPTLKPGTRDFESRVEQLKNSAFLSARKELKGGGAITDFEGQKAESALNRASYATSEEDFKQAMQEFKEAVVRGYTILEQQAGGQQQGVQAPVSTPIPNQGNKTSSGVQWKIK